MRTTSSNARTISSSPARDVIWTKTRRRFAAILAHPNVHLADRALPPAKGISRARLRWMWMYGTLLFLGFALGRYLLLIWVSGNLNSFNYLRLWDGVNYSQIAHYGYFSPDGLAEPDPDTYYRRLAFFPGLPVLMRLLYTVGIPYTAAGILVACVCGVAMTVAVMAIAQRCGVRSRGQIGAAVLFLGAPLSLTFQMVYTEAPFLAFSLWACYWILRRRWYTGAAFVWLAGFFRLTAVDLWLAFGIVVGIYAMKQWRVWLAWALSCSSFAGYVAFASAHTKEIGGYFGLQARGWHSKFDFGAHTFSWVAQQLRTSTEFTFFVAIAAMIAAVVVCFWTFGRTPWILWLFSAGVAANILLSGGSMHSRPRLLLPVLAALIPIVGAWAERTSIRTRVMVYILWSVFGAYISVHMLVIFRWAL